jgi:hypothetical protein
MGVSHQLPPRITHSSPYYDLFIERKNSFCDSEEQHHHIMGGKGKRSGAVLALYGLYVGYHLPYLYCTDSPTIPGHCRQRTNKPRDVRATGQKILTSFFLEFSRPQMKYEYDTYPQVGIIRIIILDFYHARFSHDCTRTALSPTTVYGHHLGSGCI